MEDDSIVIRRRDIKIRRSWGNIKPETKVEPTKKRKREKDNLRRYIQEELENED